MTDKQWECFCNFRSALKAQCGEWTMRAETLGLPVLQQTAAAADNVPLYPLEHSVVYPSRLDEYSSASEIKLIVIADNPGKDEQLQKNRNYLVGQAGKLGDGFFKANPELGVNFRENVLILNKTPIHTAKTKELAYLIQHGGSDVADLIEESVRCMASYAAQLTKAFLCPLWLVGYGELKRGALFASFGTYLQQSLDVLSQQRVFVFQHFSMNRFSIDLRAHTISDVPLSVTLEELGTSHRREIFGW